MAHFIRQEIERRSARINKKMTHQFLPLKFQHVIITVRLSLKAEEKKMINSYKFK
jgi:hypothetical protein